MRSRAPSRRRLGVSLAVPIGVVISTLLVYQSSDAAFYARTSNGTDSWSAATVKLSVQTSAATSINLTGMLPSVPVVTCVNVQYNGSVDANVRLYGTNYSAGGLGQYLTVQVEEGQPAPNASCAGFASLATIFPVSGEKSTLSDFMANRTDFASGAGTWKAAANVVRGYRFTFTVADNNAAQNQNTSATFNWEAQAGN